MITAVLTLSSSAHGIDLSFDDPDFSIISLSWQSAGSPVKLVDDGLNGSKGIEPAIWRPTRNWSRVVYREETFDTGIPCCAGDPVVPLSIMFRYASPTLGPGVRVTSPFAGLLLSNSLSSGPTLQAEVGWHQSAAGDPLDFYLSVSSTAGAGAGRRIFPENLQFEDGHWYRLATTFGESNAGNLFSIRVEDFGPSGSVYLSTLVDSTIITNSGKSGVNGSYAGFLGSIIEGGGGVVFDEFHDTFGDFNSSGVVDAADYTLWRDTLSTRDQRTNQSGDAIVDEDDYQIWRENFGRRAYPTSQPAVNSGVVPEPSAFSLATAVLAAIACSRSGRNRRLPNDTAG